jgi:hypothetical protein
MSPPGLTATPPSGDSTPSAETLIKHAHKLLDNCGIEMSASKISRLVRTFQRRVERNGFPFEAFLVNSAELTDDERRQALAGPGRRRVKGIPADPTAELAVDNLAAIEDAVQSLGVKPGDEIKVRRAGARVIRVRRNDVISGGAHDAA